MSKKRRTYTTEFKSEAVRLVTEEGYTVAEAALSLGIHANLLTSWRRKFKTESEAAAKGSLNGEEVQSDDRLEAQPSWGCERVGSTVPGQPRERSLVGGYHVCVDSRRLVVPGGRRGHVHTEDRGLVAVESHGQRTRDAGSSDGDWPSASGRGSVGSLRSWQPVRQCRLPAFAERARDQVQHEPQGQLLGQRTDGKLLRHFEEGFDSLG